MNMDNSVLNNSSILLPRQLPGVYMILCLTNDYRYYGETSNISGRFASHKSMLRRKTHVNHKLQRDWNLYGELHFHFIVLYIGEDWKSKTDRIPMESKLIAENGERCYNVFESCELRVGNLNGFYQKRHSEKTKLLMSSIKKGIPNDALGKKISIQGKCFPSIAQASRELGHSRKLIRTRMNSSSFTEWYIEELDF
jgi:group I intron endonuclease